MTSFEASIKLFIPIICLFSLNFYSTLSFAQTSIRADYTTTNPIPKDSPLELEEKLSIHQAFLAQAQAENNLKHEFYGQLYLSYDYLKNNDFVKAAEYLLAGKVLAEQTENDAWLGWMSYWQGVLKAYLKNNEEALSHFQDAADFCAVAGDSLCYAESLEQVAAKLMYFDSFALAERYFNQAIPMLAKFGEQTQLATAYGNFGAYYLLKRQPEKSIPFLEEALALNQTLENYKAEGKNRNNIADAYRRMGNSQKAIQQFRECIAFNQKHHLTNNLINNYLGLYFVYESVGDYKSALENVARHEELKDSLIGVETQKKIAVLETKYQVAQTEAALHRSEAELAVEKLNTTRAVALAFIAFGLIGVIAWRWQTQMKQARKEKLDNHKNLLQLTKTLAKKHQHIAHLEDTISGLKVENKQLADPAEDANSLYHSTILTEEDWSAFKTSFEKSYPGFQFSLRKKFPDLTPAEERLFLLLKLNLDRKEIADILGISVGGVKKTRTRLRKRLPLDSEDSLEDFIRDFK